MKRILFILILLALSAAAHDTNVVFYSPMTNPASLAVNNNGWRKVGFGGLPINTNWWDGTNITVRRHGMMQVWAAFNIYGNGVGQSFNIYAEVVNVGRTNNSYALLATTGHTITQGFIPGTTNYYPFLQMTSTALFPVDTGDVYQVKTYFVNSYTAGTGTLAPLCSLTGEVR